jgi:hypothetical protein
LRKTLREKGQNDLLSYDSTNGGDGDEIE